MDPVSRFARWLNRWTPDPMVFALGMTLLAFGAAWVWGSLGLWDLAVLWRESARGIWSLLAFAMQMCLVLMLGAVVARTPPVARLLHALAAWPRTARQATALVAVAATGTALLNWGMGLVVGALLAREVHQGMARAGRPAHGPALAAAGYCGLAVWHGGLSGSAPLMMTRAEDVQKILGSDLAARVGTLPLDLTLGSTRNLLTTAAAVVVCVGVLTAMTPARPDPEPPDAQPPSTPEPDPQREGADQPWLVRRLEQGPALTRACGALGALSCAELLTSQGLGRLDPNAVNTLMLTAALLLVGSPAALVTRGREAASAASGILLQFPLYAGIVGLLVHSGLAAQLAAWMPQDGRWLPVGTLLSAGLLNLAIPSGGGQFAVQGPVVLEAAANAGVEPARVVMALAWGDQWTNLLQPFWALPLLGITGRRAGELLAYTAPLCLALGAVFILGAVL